MQRLEVSGAVRLIYRSLGVKGLKTEQLLILRHSYLCRRDVYLVEPVIWLCLRTLRSYFLRYVYLLPEFTSSWGEEQSGTSPYKAKGHSDSASMYVNMCGCEWVTALVRRPDATGSVDASRNVGALPVLPVYSAAGGCGTQIERNIISDTLLQVQLNIYIPPLLDSSVQFDICWTVHHCDNWRIKNQIDVTYYFILLLIGSTCFGHYYAHHQELATMMLITALVLSILVCCRLEVSCG